MITNGPGEILLVEDNPRDAELTLRTFADRHLSNAVTWVKDGAAALDFVCGTDGQVGRRPCVILLDLKLPKIDGLEVLRALKARAETRTIPVVILTSSSEERDVLASYELGANSYVVKPVEFDAFSEAVASLGLYWLLLNSPPRPAGEPREGLLP
jgi:two-component system, response regulator